MSKSTSSKHVKKEKKELTPSQQKLRIASNWIINILCVVIIIFSLVVAVFSIVRSTNAEGITNFGGKVYMSVMSDSMKPTFAKDDMIVCDEYKGDGSDLKVGQVVTFKTTINIGGTAYEGFNTHRIKSIENEGTANAVIITKGDAVSGNDASITASRIVATWGGVSEDGTPTNGKILKGLGAMGNWLQDPEQGRIRFFCVIVLPLILLFVIYAFILIRTLVIAKIDKVKADKAGAATITADSLSDEEKRRLAEEYLASLGKGSSDLTAADGAADTSTDAQSDAVDNDAKTADVSAPTSAEGIDEKHAD